MTTETETCEITTKAGETVSVPQKHIVRIIDGIMGFSEFENFALIPQGEDSPFLWLQSVDEPNLAFLTLNPEVFAPEYKPIPSQQDLDCIKVTSVDEAIVQVIVVIPEDPQQMTANLLGPILINSQSGLARQAISQSPAHKIRHRVLPEDKS